ncbi:MAG: sigma-54-dependent Fis family transcriptional regulator [candidate division Zixibacteria bacterium]|nr:sigma-54-dependent Fis family transcriptional regulator [candidate division Zixibacteria bacterium]
MILIIDDDIAVRTSLSLLLKQAGYQTQTAADMKEALDRVNKSAIDLAIMDMNFSLETSGEEGLRLLKEIKTNSTNMPVILITAWGSIPLAVEGMKSGASDFINKPWSNEHLLQSIKTSLSLSSQPVKPELKPGREQLDKSYNFEMIIGEDPAFLAILETIGRVSATDASILIIGESGTGKELIAEAIHQNSPRRNAPFVKVNLGGISRNLFESEMFGHKKGAFTDAKNDRLGRFELADKGSIFLDEIGDLDINSQVKLLRVLQDRTFEVLGSSDTRSVDIRVISATNRNLEDMVENSEFREDLFYRINLITVKMPALRERLEDIPLLVEHYINNLKTIYQRDAIKVSAQAMDWLKDLPWPGNIRELKNLVERTVLVSDKNSLEVGDFQAQYRTDTRKGAKDSIPAVGTMTLEEMEISMIKKALEFHDGNISKVSRSLGLSRAALYRRLEKYGIST